MQGTLIIMRAAILLLARNGSTPSLLDCVINLTRSPQARGTCDLVVMILHCADYFFFFFFFLSAFFGLLLDFDFFSGFMDASFFFFLVGFVFFFDLAGFFDFDLAFFFFSFFDFDCLAGTSKAAAVIVASALTGPKPGTAHSEFSSVAAMSSAVLNPCFERTAAMDGPMPEISVIGVLIYVSGFADLH